MARGRLYSFNAIQRQKGFVIYETLMTVVFVRILIGQTVAFNP